tara:strand:+ start:432 stop:731 length:300 start_codon:yes stop_codon:yes gene_type:complete
MYELLSIKPDDNKKNKMVATFKNKETNRSKTVHFGQLGADDYTKTKNKEQRDRYLERHGRGKEDWNDYTSKGSLSRYILWGDKTTIQGNIKDYKKHFKL